jgi:hypothetical protein
LPKETLQAAAVDGAGPAALPPGDAAAAAPIIAVLVVFSTIWDFKIFDQIYVMAAGVPDRGADTAAVAYREGFALHYGLGSAVAVVLFPDPARLLDPLRAADREGGGAVTRWLRRRGWKYGAMIAVAAVRAVPRTTWWSRR